MKGEKWLNYLVLVAALVFLSLWAWWLFRPQPIPFTLKARWKVKHYAMGIAFSPKGDWLARPVLNIRQGQSILTVHLWKVAEAKATPKVFTVSQQVEPIGFHLLLPHLGFSPDGRLLAVGYMEQDLGKVAFFNVSDGRKLRVITMGKSKPIWAPRVTFAPDGRLAVLHDLRLWFIQVNDDKKVPTKIQATHVVFSPDGRWMAVVPAIRLLNEISIYDAKGRLVQKVQLIPNAAIMNITFSKDGQRLACLWLSSKLPHPTSRWGVSVWRVSNWQLEWSKPLTPFLECFFFGSAALDPNLLLAALIEPDPSSWDGLLWRLESLVIKLMGHGHSLNPPTQVVVRRLSDGQIVAKLPRFGRNVFNCAFSSDGHYLYVSHGNTIVLWECKDE